MRKGEEGREKGRAKWPELVRLGNVEAAPFSVLLHRTCPVSSLRMCVPPCASFSASHAGATGHLPAKVARFHCRFFCAQQ